MAQQTTARLKEWFSTNAHPTQQQFHDWLDSYRHRSEMIALNDVEGLAMALQGKGDMVYIDGRIEDAIQANNDQLNQYHTFCNGLCYWRRKCKYRRWCLRIGRYNRRFCIKSRCYHSQPFINVKQNPV